MKSLLRVKPTDTTSIMTAAGWERLTHFQLIVRETGEVNGVGSVYVYVEKAAEEARDEEMRGKGSKTRQ